MLRRTLLLLLAFFCFTGVLSAQKQNKKKANQEDKWLEDAEYFYSEGNYQRALPLYKRLSESHPDDSYFHFHLGVCYLYKNDEKELAIVELEKAQKIDPEIERIDYYLGRAYHLNYKFDQAIVEFNQSLAKDKLNDKEKKEINHYIDYCVNGKILCKDTAEIELKNIGDPINTENSEYVPLITIDESTLIFTYRGSRSTGGLEDPKFNPDSTGEYYEDIMVSDRVGDHWQSPEPISNNVNTRGHDATVALSNDGQILFIFKSTTKDGGDIFQSDNIIELYKSRAMIAKTLLSKGESGGETLIERYITANNLRDKWKSKSELKNINFEGNPTKFSRLKDSIINDLVNVFNKQYLKILKPDRKLSIIEVDVTLTDESLAKDFTNNIVSVVNSFYIQTKTKKLLKNVQVLQLQADSIRNVLNNSIYGVANAADASPNANPLLSVLKAPIQKKQIDVQVSTGVYAEVLKNLELTKIQLRNETPLIQNIDSPILPLQVIRLGGLKGMMVGFFLGLVISALGVLLRGYLTNKLTIN